MDASIPQKGAMAVQHKPAAVEPPKPEPHSVRNLLMGAFSRNWEPPLSVRRLQIEHVEALRNTTIGRDFALMTSAGVEFKIHSIMVIGGSKMLEEGLFPGGATQPNPPTVVNLPPHHHPILVDRLVSFIYTSDYHLHPLRRDLRELNQEDFSFFNASFIPADDPPSPAVTALVGMHHDMLDLHMYALAEELDYPALKTVSLAKLTSAYVLSHKRSPPFLKYLVDATFAPLGTPTRICKDENGALQNLAVAAIITHDALEWTRPQGEARRKEFTDSVQGPEYAGFWSAYHAVKEQNKDILEKSAALKEAADKRAKAAEERRAGAQARAAVAAAKGGQVSKGSPTKAVGVSKKSRYPKGKAKITRPDDDGDVEME